MAYTEKVFADGLNFRLPNDGAPDFVKGSLTIDVPTFINFLQSQGKDKVNLDLKIAKSGKPYAELNTWVPKTQS